MTHKRTLLAHEIRVPHQAGAGALATRAGASFWCAVLHSTTPETPVFRKIDAMLDPKAFEEFSNRLSALIAASPAADIEKNARALLSGFFAKMDLVTREEFDIQAQVLLRTHEKLKALEDRVTRLENPPSGD